jgi:hypothetical protein
MDYSEIKFKKREKRKKRKEIEKRWLKENVGEFSFKKEKYKRRGRSYKNFYDEDN